MTKGRRRLCSLCAILARRRQQHRKAAEQHQPQVKMPLRQHGSGERSLIGSRCVLGQPFQFGHARRQKFRLSFVRGSSCAFPERQRRKVEHLVVGLLDGGIGAHRAELGVELADFLLERGDFLLECLT
jgi:hypothetical protein